MDIQNGLKPIKRDVRDLSFHRTFGGFAPLNLPAEFSVDSGLTMPDQVAMGLPLGCTAVTQNELCTDQDDVIYDDYEFTYRKTLEKEGVYQLNIQGCDIRDSLSTLITFGPRKKIEGDTYEHRRGRYYAVESSGYDWFDSIRSVIYTNFIANKIKCSVSIGTPWFREFDVMHVTSTGIIPTVFTGDITTLSWHNWAIKGWKVINGETYVLGKTWQGKNYGDAGWAYYSRETINKLMAIKDTGAFTVAPKRPGDEATIQKNILETILAFCKGALNLLFKQQAALPKQSEPAPTIPPDVIPSPYSWDSFDATKHSVRVICDESGLSLAEKNIICAVIQQESQFSNKAINKNKNTDGVIMSTDWGICQINDHYQVGPGKPFYSVDDIIKNPDKAVRFMIQMYKAGNLKLWVAYSSGAYKKYL